MIMHGLNSKKAISLIETLMAIVFLLAIIGPIAGLFSQSVFGTILNRDEMLANDYAADLMSIARALPYDELPVVERMHLNYMVVDNYSEKELEPGFNRYITISEFTSVDSSQFDYKVITVEVEWKSSGVKRSISMPGLIMRVKKT